jgi:hypothetical protein
LERELLHVHSREFVGDPNARSNSDAYSDSNVNTNTYADRNAITHSDCHCYANNNTDRYTGADRNTHSKSDS